MPYVPPPDYVSPPDAGGEAGYVPPPDYVAPPDATTAPPANPGVMAHPMPGGKIALIPTRDASGRDLTDEEAQKQYWETGNHIGVYNNPEEATRAANAWVARSASMPMMSAHQTKRAGITEIIPGMRAGAISREQSPIKEFGEQFYAHGKRSAQETTAGLLRYAGEAFPIGEGADTGTIRGQQANPLTGAASEISRQIKETPMPEAKTTMGKIGAVIGGVAPHLTPLAPLTMGTGMYEAGYESAKERGADEASAQLSGLAQGGIGATIGAAGRITKTASTALEPVLSSQYPALWSALTKEIALGGRGPVSKFVSDLLVGATKSAVDFTAMGAANDAISEAAAPLGGSPTEAAANLQRRLDDIKMGIAFHAVPKLVGAAVGGARDLVRGKEPAKPVIELSGIGEEPERVAETAAPIAESEPTRTRESILAEAKRALESGDPVKAMRLRKEAGALPETNTPAEELKPEPSQEPIPPQQPVGQSQRRFEVESGLGEQADTIEALNQRREQLLTDIQSATEQATNAGRKRGPEGRRIAQKTVEGLRGELADIEQRISENTGKAPEEMGWENTRQAWENLKAEMKKPGGERGAIGPDVSQGEGTADIPGRVADLVAAASKDGYRNASEWLADMRDKMPDEDFKAFYQTIGGVDGANKAWSETAVSRNAEQGGLTPQGSGSNLLSNEEIQRAQRGDNYYRVDRTGNVTNLGPQPDAPVRNGEAIIMVSGKTGEPQVQNSQGLGNDQAVLSRFGNKVMQVHEMGRGMTGDLYSGLDIPRALRDTAEAAKRELGLPKGATDADLGREVMGRIGKLGATVKETVVRIMSKIKGIGRDVAQALAEHFHNAISGTRESQLGAIGPDIKAEKQAHRQEFAEMLKEFYPGDSPEAKAARHAAWQKYSFPGEKIPPQESVKPVETKAVQDIGQRVATALKESVAEPARAMKDIWTWKEKNPVVEFFNEADKRGMIQHQYDGSGRIMPISDTMVTGLALPVLKDMKFSKSDDVKRFMLSPHIIEDGIWPTAEGPTVDMQKAATHMVMMRGETTRFFQDILKPFGDNSAEMQKEIAPLFKTFRRNAERFFPLDSARRELVDKLNSAKESKNAEAIQKAKTDLDTWDERNGDMHTTLSGILKGILARKDAMIKDFASKYADARIYLAAEGKEVPGLTPQERKAADAYREAMQAFKAKLDKAGIPTLDEDYVPHLIRQLDPEAFQVSMMPGAAKRIPEILKFASRMEDSSSWLPSAYGSASLYVPTVAKKLAMQPILDKWRPMVDPKNLEGYANPGSENYAPNAAAYVESMLSNMQRPKEVNPISRIVDHLKAYETFRLLAFNPRTGYKHLYKLANMLGEHHAWLAPGGKDLVEARIAGNPVLRGIMDKLGIQKSDWRAKAQLVHQFYGTREILGMLQENPFVSGLTDPIESKIAGSKGAKAIGNTRLFIKNALAQPVKAVEAFENGLNILSSIEKGRNIPFEKTMNGMILNILDYNFRGGADAAEYIKNPASRWAVMFTQTPQKLGELHAKIVRRGLSGSKDIFGSEDSAKMVRHIIALGAIAGAASMKGVNWADSMLHVAGVNMDFLKHAGKWGYYEAKSKLTGNQVDEDKAFENQLLLLADKGIVNISPFFGLKDEFDTLTGGGPEAWLNSMSGVKQIRALSSGKPPRGYATPGAYITGTQTPEEKESLEAWKLKQGLREKRKIMRRSEQ